MEIMHVTGEYIRQHFAFRTLTKDWDLLTIDVCVYLLFMF